LFEEGQEIQCPGKGAQKTNNGRQNNTHTTKKWETRNPFNIQAYKKPLSFFILQLQF